MKEKGQNYKNYPQNGVLINKIKKALKEGKNLDKQIEEARRQQEKEDR